MDQSLMVFFRGIQGTWDGQVTFSMYRRGFEIAEFQQKAFNNPHTAAHIMIRWILENGEKDASE